MKNKWIIFDLDGTLADIEDRRKLSTKEDGKMDWDKFFDPNNIELDKPKTDVIMMAQALSEIGYQIAIFSGRSHATDEMTRWWLAKHDVPWNILKMRPTNNKYKWMPDEKLKLQWFNETFAEDENMSEAEVVAVFDDRDKVVNMWREIGLTCMQVAPGNF
jgi:FMN phosphatase YigB (HAD superfamily)